MILPADLDARLYAELIPSRPTPAEPDRMEDGPTAAFRALELDREKWSLPSLFDDAYPDEGAA